MNDSFPGLKIEYMDDGIGEGLILLEQESSGNVERVSIHPVHLRYMAEKCGLVATSDPTAQSTIAALTRRLLLLRTRIDHLGEWLASRPEHPHIDLTYEVAYATGTADIAAEFCAELNDPAPRNGSSLARAEDLRPSSNPQHPK